tara:strand:- start:84 stop:743 length:660 start_codon:yes stop_codon:yes gene_type:complete
MKKKNLNKIKKIKKDLLLEILDYNNDGKWDNAVHYPRRLNKFTGKYQDSTTHPLKGAGYEYIDDLKFMYKVVSVDELGYSLKYASKKLKNNKDLVKKAIFKNPYRGFEYASKELKKDKNLILWCIRNKYEIHFWDINIEILKDKKLTYNYIKTFNYSPFFGFDTKMMSLKKNKEMLSYEINHKLPKFFAYDKNFIKKIRKNKLIDFAYKNIKKYKLIKK